MYAHWKGVFRIVYLLLRTICEDWWSFLLIENRTCKMQQNYQLFHSIYDIFNINHMYLLQNLMLHFSVLWWRSHITRVGGLNASKSDDLLRHYIIYYIMPCHTWLKIDPKNTAWWLAVQMQIEKKANMWTIFHKHLKTARESLSPKLWFQTHRQQYDQPACAADCAAAAGMSFRSRQPIICRLICDKKASVCMCKSVMFFFFPAHVWLFDILEGGRADVKG